MHHNAENMCINGKCKHSIRTYPPWSLTIKLVYSSIIVLCWKFLIIALSLESWEDEKKWFALLQLKRNGFPSKKMQNFKVQK